MQNIHLNLNQNFGYVSLWHYHITKWLKGLLKMVASEQILADLVRIL